MAELSPEDQIALHEFSVRYRAALAKQHPLSDLQLESIQDAIRGDYEREQEASRNPSIKPPDREKEKEREPEEPEP